MIYDTGAGDTQPPVILSFPEELIGSITSSFPVLLSAGSLPVTDQSTTR